jgi:S1-C subfamily serine protease
MRIRCTMAAIVFSYFFAISTPVRCQSLKMNSQDLATLTTLSYVRAPDDTNVNGLDYYQLKQIIDVSAAYSKGLEALPLFHEPIATRGGTGISVYRRVSPSVVLVLVANYKDDKMTESALGTGVIVNAAGDVLTNWHVVHGFENGVVFLKPLSGTEPDKNSAYGIRIVAQNEEADLALLRILKPPAGLSPVKFGDISGIQVAEDIHIIGHPHGQLWSYSTGVVSQVRDNYDWQYSDGSKHLAKVLQMQTAINPGNSGGPVLDDGGNMLGLVAMSEEGQNLNYAVAIDVIKGFISSSMTEKTRGALSKGDTVAGERFKAATASGLGVTKIVYPDLVSYITRDSKGSISQQFAETRNGDVILGSNPNAFGGFSEWRFVSPSGQKVTIKSSALSADVISMTPSN